MTESTQGGMLMDHEYDGIREFDNPLPSWWSWIFAVSVIFSLVYYAYYHMGVGPTIHDKYQTEVAAHVEKLLAQLGDIQADNATILDYSRNTEWMAAARGMFVGNCSQCHATDGGGNVGPNLTDDQFINVKEPKDIFTVITKGVAGKGMQAWGDRLSEPQRILLASFVVSLRGTTPSKPKAAEGPAVPPWETFEDAPTSSTLDLSASAKEGR
jgi:cytochrome c oxidase cbb3-type subunit 3